MRLTPLNTFINDLDSGAEHGLSRFVDDAKLGVVIDTQGSCADIQTDAERLEKKANRNLLKFNNKKWKFLHLRKNKLLQQSRGEGQPSVKELSRKGPGCPGGHEVEREPAVWCCSRDGQQCLVLR